MRITCVKKNKENQSKAKRRRSCVLLSYQYYYFASNTVEIVVLQLIKDFYRSIL